MLETIRTEPDGFVSAPQAPGLGHRIDWDAMRAATIHKLDSHTFTSHRRSRPPDVT